MLPSAFLYGFAILAVQYWVDKHCLVRSWSVAPAIGPNLARISRRYFFSSALVAFIFSSAYAWAQFPFDNVCEKVGNTEKVPTTSFENVQLLDGSIVPNLTISRDEPLYFCR